MTSQDAILQQQKLLRQLQHDKWLQSPQTQLLLERLSKRKLEYQETATQQSINANIDTLRAKLNFAYALSEAISFVNELGEN